MSADFTPAQLWALDTLTTMGFIASSTYGITLHTARSLERRGLVTVRHMTRTVPRRRGGGSKRIDSWVAYPVKKEES